MQPYRTVCVSRPLSFINALARTHNPSLIMKPGLILLLSVCCCAFIAAAAELLTQQDVTKLLELKIPEQTIIEKVKSSGTSFVLGTADIDRLKKAGATDALISAMQSSSAVPATGN